MKYVIRQTQLAALKRALAKIGENPKPGKIIPLTVAEWDAYQSKIIIGESSDSVDVNALLEDVPEPEKPKRMIRLVKRRLDDPNVWHATAWSQDIPCNRRDLEEAADKRNKDPLFNTSFSYQIEEREAQDGEEY